MLGKDFYTRKDLELLSEQIEIFMRILPHHKTDYFNNLVDEKIEKRGRILSEIQWNDELEEEREQIKQAILRNNYERTKD